MSRSEFALATRDSLAKRSGSCCSNPHCKRGTFGPRTESHTYVSIGVAAHITAASPGGPRYDSNITNEARRSANNGIWLCQNCAKLIDNDPSLYTVELIRVWKLSAEEDARAKLTNMADAPEYLNSTVAPMSNQATPALSCIEHLRLENINAPWIDTEPFYDAAKYMIDGAGERLRWDVLEISDIAQLDLKLLIADYIHRVKNLLSQTDIHRSFLALVACGSSVAENASTAQLLIRELSSLKGNTFVYVLIGYAAELRFADVVMMQTSGDS